MFGYEVYEVQEKYWIDVKVVGGIMDEAKDHNEILINGCYF